MKYEKIKDKLIPDANNRIKVQDGKVTDPMSEQVNGEWMVNPVALTENNVFVVCFLLFKNQAFTGSIE